MLKTEVMTLNQLDEPTLRTTYDFLIRSNPMDGNRYTKDPLSGSCIRYGSKVWLQNAKEDSRFRK